MVDSETVNKYTHFLPFDSWHIVPAVGKSGGMAFGFLKNSSLEVLSSTFNMIHVVCDITPIIKNCLVTFIYGALNTLCIRNQWNYLKYFNESDNRPWLLLGDFNFILNVSEKQGGIPENSLASDFIKNSLSMLNMHDVFSFGNPFTWCNRRFKNPSELIFEKLDRGFINDNWVSLLPQTRVTNLGRVFSNHCPILLQCFHSTDKLAIPFKYFKCWQANPEFKDILVNSWKKLRNMYNTIHMLKDNQGNWLENKDQVLHLLDDHFKKIFASSMPRNSDIDDVLMDIKPIISDELNSELVAIPSENEIFTTIKNMAPWKYPGPDGFLDGFFRDNWDHISTEVINHSAFIANKQIHDNIIISHEILHSFKTRKRKNNKDGFMAIKLDLSKAFDRLEWPFIIAVFKNLGFSDDWCQVIHQCINTVSYSILVNGSPG
ncbi:uncharacterized protein LOC113278839 [Papaver somniferum]|uniref:uncharacterized protein LOC113278839 n=1 Tax=Papaver somniferum TaxID=3469 RepID=UPI000E6FACF1|nr:uncharacterized protein LOC113278839 [Papaver somniferum]